MCALRNRCNFQLQNVNDNFFKNNTFINQCCHANTGNQSKEVTILSFNTMILKNNIKNTWMKESKDWIAVLTSSKHCF